MGKAHNQVFAINIELIVKQMLNPLTESKQHVTVT